ncbi:Mov34/MPN/PAD-1 family protein [Vibrio vulnificus]|uniref:Mov34/MPN/PAD-1 family protein n=1 Tax=Vibrio vulnificus TaxID=672 RepID=UPI0040589035
MCEPLIMTYLNKTIVVEPNVQLDLQEYRQCRPNQPEQGGTLLGEWRGEHMRVTRITRPQTTDKATRNSFVRCGRTHSKLIRIEWEESGGLTNYLGEWHTHPEPYPTPSTTDLTNWKRLNGPDPVLLMIQGTVDTWWGILVRGQFYCITNSHSQSLVYE